MKKTFLTVVCLYLYLFASPQTAADTSYEKTVFWQITGEGIKDTSYLFGTMHPVFREDVHIADNMLQALLRSKTVFFEHPVYTTDDTACMLQSCMEKPNLRRVLGGVCYRLLLEHLQQYNDTLLSSPYLTMLDPAFWTSRVIRNIFGSAVTSIDATLIAIALGNDQAIAYLDTPEMEQELKEMISPDEEATRLYNLLRDIEKVQHQYIKQVKDFTRQYYNGNFGYIYSRNTYLQINDRLGGMHVSRNIFAEKVLDKRNRKWLPLMMDAMKQKASFFAIGAAHLAGSAGLINLLRKNGYTVEPVMLVYKQL